MSERTPPSRTSKKNYFWIAGLCLFGIIPLLKKCISDYRYNTEIRPIAEGLRENYLRKEAVIPGDTGRIFVLTAADSVRVKYHWYNGYQSLPNDSLFFRLSLGTREGRTVFSRDTTVGQIVCVLIDVKNDSSDNVNLFGIYFKEGSDEPMHNNMNLRRAMIYAVEPGYAAYFVADTFDKDPQSATAKLAQQRLNRINKELMKKKIDSFQIKEF